MYPRRNIGRHFLPWRTILSRDVYWPRLLSFDTGQRSSKTRWILTENIGNEMVEMIISRPTGVNLITLNGMSIVINIEIFYFWRSINENHGSISQTGRCAVEIFKRRKKLELRRSYDPPRPENTFNSLRLITFAFHPPISYDVPLSFAPFVRGHAHLLLFIDHRCYPLK